MAFDPWLRGAGKLPLLALAVSIGQRIFTELLAFMGHQDSLLYQTFNTASQWAMLLAVLSVGVMLLARHLIEGQSPG